MHLTTNPIDDVLTTGNIINTEIARKFISRVQLTIGINIIACYIQSGSHIYLPPGETIQAIVKKKDIEFINEAILTVYIHSRKSQSIADESKFKDKISSCFYEILAEENAVIDYPRDYLLEEMVYYGWYSMPKDKWDMKCVIPHKSATRNSLSVNVEYIDKLALWRYLSESKGYANNCSFIDELNAKVYCGFNEVTSSMAYYVILPSNKINAENNQRISNYFLTEMVDVLRSKDKFDVISEDAVKPIITTWESLSEEQKNMLQRS